MALNPDKDAKDFNASYLFYVELDRAVEQLSLNNLAGFEHTVFCIDALCGPLKDAGYDEDITGLDTDVKYTLNFLQMKDQNTVQQKRLGKLIRRLEILCNLMNREGVYGLERAGRWDERQKMLDGDKVRQKLTKALNPEIKEAKK